MLPTDAKPVSKWSDRDEALWDVTSGVAKAFVNLIESWPSKEEWIDKGIALRNLKKYEESLAADEQALLLDPSYMYAWYNKGITLRSLKRDEEALAAYEQALLLDPNNAYAQTGKSIALRNLKKSDAS